jgi:Tfp pilus assembly protein PilN
MNEINFLPQSFLDTQNRRLRLFREIAILSGMVLIGLAMFAGQSGRVMSIRNQVERKSEELAAAELRSAEVAKLKVQQQNLKLQLAVHDGLAMPLNMSSILASIAHLLPERMALTEITCSADSPKLDLSELKKTSATTKKSSKKKVVIKPVERVMQIQVMGLSPSDVDVANLVGALSASPIFQNVKMRYSKGASIEKVMAREFRLEMEVSLDCIYQMPIEDANNESTGKEVAHVE